VAPASARHAGRRREPSWLHLDFPQLPLEVLTRGLPPARACVLGTGEGRRATVWMANTRAACLGVKPGLPLAAAHALGELAVLERNARAERRALERLGLWALQLSPQVSLVPDSGRVVEIGGSLRSFGGLERLLGHLRREARALGYRLQYAVAPVPLAATVLARAAPRTLVLDRHDLTRSLAGIPLDALRLEPAWHAALAGIGVRHLGDCRRLPRGDLARRFSPALIDLLDRLYGQAPDPRPALPLPPSFHSAIELPSEMARAPMLLVAGERLLHELVGYLRARVAVTQRLRWRLAHRGRDRTCFTLELARPGCDLEHMRLLLREMLVRLRLPAPVLALELDVEDVRRDEHPRARDLFPGGRAHATEAYAAFVDRLRARCGDDALRGLAERPDHRPERAWSWRPPAATGRMGEAEPMRVPLGARPLWLVRQPMALAIRDGRPELDGPLRLAPERERIDGGWWDAAVARDYFIATTCRGSQLWIYRELDRAGRWHLHGVFE
jgi:protein ImuB